MNLENVTIPKIVQAHMIYPFFFIWILLQQETLSLLQGGESLNELIQEKHAQKRSAEAIPVVLDGDALSNLTSNLNFLLPTTVKSNCVTQNLLPPYQSVVCSYAPGKIICQLGRFSFVVNNKDHHMEKDIIEKFITMAYQRYAEGDNCFDVAVDERDTTPCACYASQTPSVTQLTPSWQLPPVTVECDLVSNEKLKLCNPQYEPTEKIYQCKAKVLGLKKRSVVHIAVNERGKVSQADLPSLVSKIRKKREYRWDIENKNKRKRSKRFVNYLDEEGQQDEFDLSNLYYHTTVPSVRNYTDICTLKYQLYSWCPEYITHFPACGYTKSDSKKPRRQADQASCTTKCTTATTACETTTPDCDASTTVCTVEINPDDELYLKPTVKHVERKKKHKMNRSRKRRAQNFLAVGRNRYNFDKSREKKRNTYWKRNSKHFFGNTNAAGPAPVNSIFKVENQTVSTCATSTSTTTASTISSTTCATSFSPSNQTTTIKWCTITVPCNESSSTTDTTLLSTVSQTQQLLEFLDESQQKLAEKKLNELSEASKVQVPELVTGAQLAKTNSASNEATQGNKLQDQLDLEDGLVPEVKSIQGPSFNAFRSLSSLTGEMEKSNNNKRLLRIHKKYRGWDKVYDDSNLKYRQGFRPKRKIYLRKIPRMRQIIGQEND